MARTEEVKLTAAEAEAYFAKLHPPAGELADEKLEQVSGGAWSETRDLIREFPEIEFGEP